MQCRGRLVEAHAGKARGATDVLCEPLPFLGREPFELALELVDRGIETIGRGHGSASPGSGSP